MAERNKKTVTKKIPDADSWMGNKNKKRVEYPDVSNEALSRALPLTTGLSFKDAVEQRLMREGHGPAHIPYGSPEYAVKRLMTHSGLNLKAAIGAVANLIVESDLDPTIKQIGGGPGRGIAQWGIDQRWDTDRTNLLKYAKDTKRKWDDLDTQLDFIGEEMNNSTRLGDARKRMNDAKTVEDTTLIFLRDYERAGIPHTSRRVDEARALKEKIYNNPGFLRE